MSAAKRGKKRKRNEIAAPQFSRFSDDAMKHMYMAWIRFASNWIDQTTNTPLSIDGEVVVCAVTLLAHVTHGQHGIRKLDQAAYVAWILETKKKAQEVVFRFAGKRLNIIPVNRIGNDLQFLSGAKERVRGSEEIPFLENDRLDSVFSVEGLLSSPPTFRAFIRHGAGKEKLPIPLENFVMSMSRAVELSLVFDEFKGQLCHTSSSITVQVPNNNKSQIEACLTSAFEFVNAMRNDELPRVPQMIKEIPFVGKPTCRSVGKRVIQLK